MATKAKKPAADKQTATSKPAAVTTLAARPDIAERVRALAAEHGMSTLQVTNALLDFALANGNEEVKVTERTLVITPKGGSKPAIKRGK